MKRKRGDRLFARLLSRRRTVLSAVAVAFALLLVAVFVGRQVEIARRARALRASEEARTIALREQEVLRARLAEQDSAAAVEAVARERLGLVLPGEEKVIFVEE